MADYCTITAFTEPMLKSYIRKFAKRYAYMAGNAVSLRTPSRRWLASRFHDFVPVDGNRAAMFTLIATQTRRAASELDSWLLGRNNGRALADALDIAATQINHAASHKELTLRSYVDVSVGMRALRILVDHLASLSKSTMPVDSIEITSMMLEHHPTSRPALLVHGALLIERREADAAIDVIRRALRVQAVCSTAQQILFDAYRLKREQGSADAEISATDYDLSDKFCHLPFTHMSTGVEGNTFACACPAWVPFSIGNILDAETDDAIWNSDAAMEIRRSILDGDFSYCSRTLCSFIRAQKLPRKAEVTKPKLRAYIDNHMTRIPDVAEMVELNHDPTCNLACPSCRTEIVSATSEAVDRYTRAEERVILPLLKKVEGQTYITGGGEAFASKHFRSILRALNRNDYPGLDVYLITNGQVITPHRWSEFPNLPDVLAILSVSVDAARPATYEKLRRPGKWANLMKNLEFIAGMRRNNQIRALGLNFVVQRENFREMLEFIALGDSLGADHLWFQRVVNYGAYDESVFADIDVTAPTHPDHAELLEILRNPLFERPSINMHMLMSLLPERVASDERIEFLY